MDAAHEQTAEMISGASGVLAEWVVAAQFETDPGFARRIGSGLEAWKQDTRVRLHQLAAAVRFDRPALFAGHVAWMKAALSARHRTLADLRENLAAMHAVLHERIPGTGWAAVAACLAAGGRALESAPAEVPSALEGDGHAQALARRYIVALLEGRRDEGLALVRDAVDSGRLSLEEAYVGVLTPVQRELGRMWHMDEIGVQEEHIVSAGTQVLMAQLHERIERIEKDGRVLLASSVAGDEHELGVRMVADLFEMRGWRCVFLGANTPTPDLAEGVRAYEPDLVALSANLAVHLVEMRKAVSAVHAVAPGTPVIVGGGPFAVVDDLWRLMGADGGAASGPEAVALGERLVPRQTTDARDR